MLKQLKQFIHFIYIYIYIYIFPLLLRLYLDLTFGNREFSSTDILVGWPDHTIFCNRKTNIKLLWFELSPPWEIQSVQLSHIAVVLHLMLHLWELGHWRRLAAQLSHPLNSTFSHLTTWLCTCCRGRRFKVLWHRERFGFPTLASCRCLPAGLTTTTRSINATGKARFIRAGRVTLYRTPLDLDLVTGCRCQLARCFLLDFVFNRLNHFIQPSRVLINITAPSHWRRPHMNVLCFCDFGWFEMTLWFYNIELPFGTFFWIRVCYFQRKKAARNTHWPKKTFNQINFIYSTIH